MGSNGSKLAKKLVSSFSSDIDIHATEQTENVKSTSPIILLSRKGSMFFDEDGDLAHEFYVEVPVTRKGGKASMKRVFNITPQGEVALQHPRLHVDFPIILHHV